MIHHKTVRAAVLTLYTTGTTVGEVARLANDDVNLSDGIMQFSGSRLKSGRSIPIAKDLIRFLQQYTKWRKRALTQSEWFFSGIDGRQLTPRRLRSYFERIRRKAGIAGYRESSQRPCLRDVRATFAVHRITSWMKRRENLNVMLPALTAYMGNTALESVDRYLQLTPQRFQDVLNKLSPQTARMRWQQDPRLLEFLTSL
jgi:integrase/recombinase XerD